MKQLKSSRQLKAKKLPSPFLTQGPVVAAMAGASPITFVASANCGRYCGAAVDFVDIEPATGLMSVAVLQTKLEQAVIRLQQATAEQHRQVFEGLRAARIGVQLHYSPVHLQPYYRALGFTDGQFPEAEAYASSAISLPLFPGLSEEQQQQVVAAIRQELETLQASGAS